MLAIALAFALTVPFSGGSREAQDTSQYYNRGVFLQIDQHGSAPARIRALCPAHQALGFSALADGQDRLVEAMQHDSASALVEKLVCSRSMLFALGARSREGPGVAQGESWATAAVEALLFQLDRHPTDKLAAALLGVIVQEALPARSPAAADPVGERQELTYAEFPRIAATVYRAVQLGATSPGILRSCASLLINLGDILAAHDCSIRALSAGHDSTWHLLRISSFAFQRGDTLTGIAALERAASSARDSASRAELGWHLEPSVSACRGCIVAGAMDPTGSGTQLAIDMLSGAERDSLFSVPTADLMAWVRRTIEKRGAKQHDRRNVLHRLAGPALTEVWNQSGLVTRNFLAHFWYSSYGGGTFRACLRNLDTITCRPNIPPDPANNLVTVGNVLQVWNPVTAEPLNLVTYAIALRNAVASGPRGKDSVRIDIDLRRWSIAQPSGDDVSHHTVHVAGPTGDGTHLGLIVLPGAQFSSWSVIATQVQLRRGGTFKETPGVISSGPFDISDLILGGVEQPVAWNGGKAPVAVAPLYAFGLKPAIQLYYQVKTDVDRPRLKVAITVRPVVGGIVSAQTSFQATALQGSQAGINEVQRELDLSRLRAGEYQLEVKVFDEHGVTVSRKASLSLR